MTMLFYYDPENPTVAYTNAYDWGEPAEIWKDTVGNWYLKDWKTQITDEKGHTITGSLARWGKVYERKSAFLKACKKEYENG